MAKKKLLVHLDLTQNELQNVVLQPLGSQPATPINRGFIYYNTTSDTVLINTSADTANPVWLDLGGGGGYSHPTFTAYNPTLSGANVLASFSTNTEGHVTGVTTRSLTLADLGYTPYSHPTGAASIDTSGVQVVDTLTIDAEGHVTGVTTRNITAAEFAAVIINDVATTGTNITWSIDQIKTYVGASLTAGMEYKGAYDASTNIPDLDSTPSGVVKGDTYTVTVAGTFFTTPVEVGDVIIAEIDSAATEADWTIVNKNIDLVSASESAEGIIEIATQAEVDAGTDDAKAVTPLKLEAALADERLTFTSGDGSVTIDTATPGTVNLTVPLEPFPTALAFSGDDIQTLTLTLSDTTTLSDTYSPSLQTITGLTKTSYILRNQANADNSTQGGNVIMGYTNTVTGGDSNFIAGFSHVVSGFSNGVLGEDHTISGNSHLVGGFQNQMTANTNSSAITGAYNTGRTNYSAIFGYNNQDTHTPNGTTLLNPDGGNLISGFNNNVNEGWGMGVFGSGQLQTGNNVVVVGQAAVNMNGAQTAINTASDARFIVGNGSITSTYTRNVASNAFVVLHSGLVTAPSLTTALIDTDAKSLVTREYLSANYASNTSIVDATTEVKGIIELATQAEVNTGTDAVRAVTPATLQGKLDTELANMVVGITSVDTSVTITNDGNGTYDLSVPTTSAATETSAGIIEIATQAEVDAGTDDVRAITPLKLEAALADERLTFTSGDGSVTIDTATPGTVDLTVTSVGPQKYTTTIGDGVATSIAVTHNLNTTFVMTQMREVSTNIEVDCQVSYTDANTVTLGFNVAPTTNNIEVTVIG